MVNILLRLLAPALVLGAVLLIGERPSNPPNEAPAAEMSAAAPEQFLRSAPCPGILPEFAVVSLPALRLPPASSLRLEADASGPEQRAQSPPHAA